MKFIKNSIFVFVFAFFLFQQLEAQGDLYLKGVAFIDKKDYPRAVQSFNEILQSSPGNIEAKQKRGEAFYNMDDYEKALAEDYLFEDESFVEDIPFDTKAIFTKSNYTNASAISFDFEDETYVNDIPFDTYAITKYNCNHYAYKH